MAKREEWIKKHAGYSKLGEILPQLTGGALKKRGMVESQLMANWNVIAGNEIAQYSVPKKVTFPRGEKAGGILHLDVYDSGAIYIQHMESSIVEKVAVYFGYKVIKAVKILQIPTEHGQNALSGVSLGEKVVKKDDIEFEETNKAGYNGDYDIGGEYDLYSINDEDLCAALNKLGRNLNKK